MPKSLVGRVKNSKFAFFWLLIGGSIGDIILAVDAPYLSPVLLPPAALSLLMALIIADKMHRPRVWMGIDLLLTLILAMVLVPLLGTAGINSAIFLPDALIIFSCILGIMKW